MNAYEIIESANYDLDHNKITLGEWEKRIEPTKNVKPIVKGEWIDEEFVSNYMEGVTWYGICSICGKRKKLDNFCPNCGADMRKESEEEE